MLKPQKLLDKELLELIKTKVMSGEYIIKNHARIRMVERDVSDYQIIAGLLGLAGYKRKRNKRKDEYNDIKNAWNYCLEASSVSNTLRIIVTFEDNLMPIITVMWLGGENGKKSS